MCLASIIVLIFKITVLLSIAYRKYTKNHNTLFQDLKPYLFEELDLTCESTKLLFLQPNGVFSKSEYLWSGGRIASGFVTDRDSDTNQFGVRRGHSTQMMPPLLCSPDRLLLTFCFCGEPSRILVQATNIFTRNKLASGMNVGSWS